MKKRDVEVVIVVFTRLSRMKLFGVQYNIQTRDHQMQNPKPNFIRLLHCRPSSITKTSPLQKKGEAKKVRVAERLKDVKSL